MNREHWKWCRQQIPVQDPAVLSALAEMNLPPCECQLVTDDMPFVRLSWLLDENRDLRDLPRMQDMDPEAFIFPSDMLSAYFISHRWLERSHPDASGRQLALALSCIYSDRLGHWSGSNWATHTGVWYDYLCVPQRPRTDPEQDQWDKLFEQVPALTLTTYPILVVDKDREYASRVWCVLESLGALRSEMPFTSTSLAMQAAKYEEILCRGASAWDDSASVEDGLQAGVAKLQSWLDATGTTLIKDPEQRKRDLSVHLECMDVVGHIFLDLGSILESGHGSDDGILLSLASRYDLSCAYEDDLLRCMRLMRNLMELELAKSRGTDHGADPFRAT